MTIESYTVAFDRNGPKQAIIVGLNNADERVLATSSENIDDLLDRDLAGSTANITIESGRSNFCLQHTAA